MRSKNSYRRERLLLIGTTRTLISTDRTKFRQILDIMNIAGYRINKFLSHSTLLFGAKKFKFFVYILCFGIFTINRINSRKRWKTVSNKHTAKFCMSGAETTTEFPRYRWSNVQTKAKLTVARQEWGWSAALRVSQSAISTRTPALCAEREGDCRQGKRKKDRY